MQVIKLEVCSKMVCRHCGKTCPEGTKFCIYCGGLLEDPEKEFMGKKFETVEECSKVRDEYNELTRPFSPEHNDFLLADLLKAIDNCKQGNYHPIAAQLALEYLNPIAEDLKFTTKRNSKRGQVRIISSLYTIFSIAILIIQPIVRTEIGSSTYLGMISLLIPGQLGFFTWIWNIVVILGIILAMICLIGFIKDSDIELNVIAPFSIPFFFIGIFILNLIPWLFGLQYEYLSAFWWLVIGGVLVGILNILILPKKK